MSTRAPLRRFLAGNPFPQPCTVGFFYREKMRAIHHIAPEEPFATILEIGGGQSGLTRMLYPDATVVSSDLDPAYGGTAANRGRSFVAADATALPFADSSFDAVTMFDVIEHIPDDAAAMRNAWRVLAPGGALLVSTPQKHWRYPHHGFMRAVGRPEAELLREWGHVRRGYAPAELEALVGARASAVATFMADGTALAHDLTWSRLPLPLRWGLIVAIAPLTWWSYWRHRPTDPGAEIVMCWRKPR